jgi:transcriptional regulator with XRE-family HTH domain
MSSVGQRVQSVKKPQGDRELTQDPQRLRRRRILAGLTVRQLSQKAGVATGSISELENGGKSARPPMLAKLAHALGCEIADLVPPEPRRNGGKAA